MEGQPGVSPGPGAGASPPDMPPDMREHAKEYDFELLGSIPNGTIFAYNLDESQTAGGMKVRWKIRVATGAEASRWDARQAEAIKEALEWLRKQQARTAR
jgi:hypothetical protein